MSSSDSGSEVSVVDRFPSGALRISVLRLGMMAWSVALFGTLSVLVAIQHHRDVFGG